MMRLAAGLTATGVIGWLLLEGLKILMIPVTAWFLGLLALALKFALMALAVGAALGVGVFFFRRAQKAKAEAEA
ncbi:MAG TPA: hypothetical protein EYQ27_12810 [Gemmatimonadetes bacterium]|nr:hypothetical protein [Gemmatimonadota bacterium]